MNNKEFINIFNIKFKNNYYKKLEIHIINFWNNIVKYKKNKKKFIIHDGPPYSNGGPHIGHLMNKILKDIIIKNKLLSGRCSNFMPGWDCHGLPIEISLEKKKNKIKNCLIINKLLKKYVNFNIKIQKKKFKELGIIFKRYYKTMNYINVSENIKIINNFLKKKYLYKNIKPIYWCFKCCSTLSEYEINYKTKKNIILLIFFLFLKIKKIIKIFKIKKKYILGGIIVKLENAWIILSNQAILIGSEIIYIIINTIKGLFILNYKDIKKKIFLKFYILNITIGLNLKNIKFLNPFFFCQKANNRNSIILINYKSIILKIKNISPSYKHEDYLIYKKKFKNPKLINIISERGKFYNKVFKNINIWKIENIINILFKKYNKILKILKINIKKQYCWRHKNNEIIQKITNQWFLKKINFSIKNIKFSKNIFKKILKKIINKNDWNISRKKKWGTPLTIIENKKNFKKINLKKFIKIIPNYILIYGSKFWNFFHLKDFYNTNFLYLKKVNSIIDVWLESGSTNWTILRKLNKKNLKFPADIFFEGIDQYRGWFQSSLIISNMLNNNNPYKKLITHGFIINSNNEKISKSLNNYNNYNNLIKFLENDILRLLLSNSDYSKNVIINKEKLYENIKIYKKIRNLIKFILSNILSNSKKKIKIKYKKNFLEIKLLNLYKSLISNYKKFNFKKNIKTIRKIIFILNKRIESLKNYLYINDISSKKRFRIQIMLKYILKIFLKTIFPITCFTSEESWNKIYYNKSIILNNYKIFKKKNKKYYNIFKNIKLNNNKIKNEDLKILIYSNYKNVLNLFIDNLWNFSKIKNNFTKIKNWNFIIKYYKKKKCKRCWYNRIRKKNKINKCKNCYIKIFKLIK